MSVAPLFLAAAANAAAAASSDVNARGWLAMTLACRSMRRTAVVFGSSWRAMPRGYGARVRNATRVALPFEQRVHDARDLVVRVGLERVGGAVDDRGEDELAQERGVDALRDLAARHALGDERLRVCGALGAQALRQLRGLG